MAAAVGNVMEWCNFGIFGYLAVSLAGRPETHAASVARDHGPRARYRLDR